MTTSSARPNSSEASISDSVDSRISFWEQMRRDIGRALDQESYTSIRSILERAFGLRPMFPSLASTLGGESLLGYGLPRTVSTNDFASREIPEQFRLRELSTCPKTILLTVLTNYLVTKAKVGDFDWEKWEAKQEDIRHQVLMPICGDIDIIKDSLGLQNGVQDDNAEISAKYKANWETIKKSFGIMKDRKATIMIDNDGNLQINPTIIQAAQPGHKHHVPHFAPVYATPPVERKSLPLRLLSSFTKKADGYSFAFGGLGAFIGLAAAGVVIVITGGWATIPFIIGVVFGCMLGGGVLGFGSKILMSFLTKARPNTDVLMNHTNTTAKLYPHLHRPKRDSVDEQFVSAMTDTSCVKPTLKTKMMYGKMYQPLQEEQVFAAVPKYRMAAAR